MMNHNKWTETLPNRKIISDEKQFGLNANKWIDTLPKQTHNNSIKKYSFTATIFVIGLILVSLIKNETRVLQKEINNLQASINIIKLNLHETTLEHEVLTSPENISKLAKEHFEFDFNHYKKSQIKKFGTEEKKFNKSKNSNYLSKKSAKLSDEMKLMVQAKISKKKKELKKLQELYSKPEEIPDEIKLTLSKRIADKKDEIKKIYSNPKEYITLDKMQKWAGVQIVKVFLGIPIVPGK